MKPTRHSRSGFRLLAAVAILTATTALTACDMSFSTAHIVSATLTTGVDKEMRPADTLTSFPTSVPVIHCLVELGNAPSETTVRARWTIIEAKGATAGQSVAEADVKAGGDNNVIDFTLTPEAGLLPGRYRVDLLINPRDGKEKPAKSIEFTVVSTGPAIAKAFLSTDPNGGQERREFPTDTDVIFCHVRIVDAAPGARVEAVWIQEGYGEIDRAPIVLEEGQNQITFNLTLSTPLPPGNYRTDIYINGGSQPARTIQFVGVQ